MTGFASRMQTFHAQVGDSVIITDTGWEAVPDHPKSLPDVVL